MNFVSNSHRMVHTLSDADGLIISGDWVLSDFFVMPDTLTVAYVEIDILMGNFASPGTDYTGICKYVGHIKLSNNVVAYSLVTAKTVGDASTLSLEQFVSTGSNNVFRFAVQCSDIGSYYFSCTMSFIPLVTTIANGDSYAVKNDKYNLKCIVRE